MKRSTLAVVLSLVFASAGCSDEPDTKWISLFNGKDLTGWKANEHAENWKVVDGVITSTGPVSHLYYMDREFENFHYKIEVKLPHGANSGMYFRTAWQDKGFPKIYEAQLNNTYAKDPKRTGSLYNFVDVKEQLIEDDKWWVQEVIAEGNHIIIKVDGKTVVDYVDEKRTSMKGHFAFQQHDPGSSVNIRSVMVKPLP